MKTLFISVNLEYLKNQGIEVKKSIIEAVKKCKFPALDDLIDFSNETGISINDFLFVDIKQNIKLI